MNLHTLSRRQFAATLLAANATFLIARNTHSQSRSSLKMLEDFIQSTRSGRAVFEQQVTAPPKDGQPARSKNSSGSFAFERPGRFKFVYQKPFEQTIVADGQTLWLHDVDLNQVTARPQAQALAHTPAALVAASTDLKALEKDFVLTEEADRDGLQWVMAKPRAQGSALQGIRVGLRASEQGPQLRVLDMLDSFGQRSTLLFNQFERNPRLPAATFAFKPPAGADVLRQ